MILTIGNIKGGVGKTTLAVNLAIALSRLKHDVMLVDGDTQASALAFSSLRKKNFKDAGIDNLDYTACALHGADIRDQAKSLARKYSDVIIDASGTDSGSLRAGLVISQIVIVPIKPRTFDFWATEQTFDLIKDARVINKALRAVALINEADAQGKDNQLTLEKLQKHTGIEIAPMLIGKRKAFPDAATAGRAVFEWRDAKANDEFQEFVRYLFNHPSDAQETANGHRGQPFEAHSKRTEEARK
jgi:chromosome partitioning protein